jgi:hypothetical protein
MGQTGYERPLGARFRGQRVYHCYTMSTSAVVLNPMQSSSQCSHPPKTHSGAQSKPCHILELRIYNRNVGLYGPPQIITDVTEAQTIMTMAPPATISPFDSTCLLSGPLDEFLSYSRQENADWLIGIAHDICDPALRRGSLGVWDEAEEIWRDVNPTDPLTTSVYLYRIQEVISLTQISARVDRSLTEATGYASTMASRVKARDDQHCWVTRAVYTVANSHVCPKRMGNHLFRIVYSAFVGPPALSIYQEICGITLNPFLDILFDKYELGLRLVAPVRNSSFLIFYCQPLVHELRTSLNAIFSLRPTGDHTGDVRCLEQQTLRLTTRLSQLNPFYMGSGPPPLGLKIIATHHMAYSDGTTYSALSRSLPIPTIKACKISIIMKYPFEWKGTLSMKARTANLSGHRLLWRVTGER